jgi:hypothetical protein
MPENGDLGAKRQQNGQKWLFHTKMAHFML